MLVIGDFVLDLVMRSAFQLLVALVYVAALVGGGWYLLSGKFMEDRQGTEPEVEPAIIEESTPVEGDAAEDPISEPGAEPEAAETVEPDGSDESTTQSDENIPAEESVSEEVDEAIEAGSSEDTDVPEEDGSEAPSEEEPSNEPGENGTEDGQPATTP